MSLLHFGFSLKETKKNSQKRLGVHAHPYRHQKKFGILDITKHTYEKFGILNFIIIKYLTFCILDSIESKHTLTNLSRETSIPSVISRIVRHICSIIFRRVYKEEDTASPKTGVRKVLLKPR
jgi:hypothetical protein